MFLNFSVGIKRDIIQNINPAPIERMQNNAMGETIFPLVKSLHTMILNPNIAYAAKHAICPIVELFFVIGYSFLIAKRRWPMQQQH